jgi:chromosome segregation ATPase
MKKRKGIGNMSVKNQVESSIQEYNQKQSELQERLQDTSDRIEILQLEIRLLNEKEIPESQAKAVLGGTDDSHVKKLKKSLQRYREELEAKQEAILILSHAIKQHQYQSGEKLVELDRLYRQEKSIQESKHYAKAMYYKKMYVDAMIEEGQKLKELNSLDFKIQSALVEAGRKNGIYTDSNVKSTATNTGDGRTYLPLSIQECQRFVSGNYSSSDYDYLKKFSSLKDLG